ncbi:MAG: type II secretion system major pseudopilin GspG [Armatimonadota bacterium]
MIRSRRRGMTPAATLLAAALVAAVALALVWRLGDDAPREQRDLTIDRLNTIADGLEDYAIDNGGVFPTSEQGLAALLTKPTDEQAPARWRGPYLTDAQVLRDAWGVPFNYVSPGGDGRPYDLWSNGADRAEGGEGANADIQSWKRSTLIP